MLLYRHIILFQFCVSSRTDWPLEKHSWISYRKKLNLSIIVNGLLDISKELKTRFLTQERNKSMLSNSLLLLNDHSLGRFNSYLWMRKQAVAVNGTILISDFLDISRGVQQGSILPTSLYHVYEGLIFWNWWPPEIKDSTILVAGITLEYVNQQLATKYLESAISSWIKNHGMALNAAKTESNCKLVRLQSQRIQINHNVSGAQHRSTT